MRGPSYFSTYNGHTTDPRAPNLNVALQIALASYLEIALATPGNIAQGGRGGPLQPPNGPARILLSTVVAS